MSRPKKIQEDTKSDSKDSQTLQLINEFLKSNRDKHFNYEPDYNYMVSSGSLRLDIEMGGGIRPGILRLCGVTEGGKSSAALTFAKNFQEAVQDGMVHYVKAEGRLSNDIVRRMGIDTSPEKWVVLKTNIYEAIIDYIRMLDKNNPDNRRHMFILDSMDAMVRTEDLDRPSTEANKVAGNQLLSSDFMRKMALALTSHGHICVLISQVRSTVNISQYAAADKNKSATKTTASGGNALLHYSDWILEFGPRWKDDIIWQDNDEKSGKALGHYCKIEFRKTPNEKTGSKVKYPVRYGQTDGKAVWTEYEVIEEMIIWGMIEKKGAGWFSFSKETSSEIKTLDIEVPEKIQGFEKLKSLFEANPNLTKHFFSRFKKALQKGV